MNQTPLPKPSNFDSYVKTKTPSLGVDLGGTKLSAGLVQGSNIVSEIITRPTPAGRENIINEIIGIINQFREHCVVTSVGIATAGVVDSIAGDILASAVNFQGWSGTKLKAIIESKTMMPVYVDNDCNACALGDVVALNFEDKTCVVGVAVGTGIGAGIVFAGKPYRGATFAAAEVGHQRIALDNKRLCSCGLFDCWEEYGAAKGLIATAKELLVGVTRGQSLLAENPSSVSTMAIAAASDAGDIIAGKTMDVWHQHLAAGFVNITAILNPDCFVLSGGLSKVIDMERLEELVKDRCLPELAERLEFHLSPLGENAGIVGAAQLVTLAV